MKLWPFTSAPPAVKQSAAAALMVNSPGQPRWTGRDFASLALEAYKINVVGFMAINRVADAIAQVEWETWNGDRLIEAETPLSRLWDRPNELQSRSEYLRAVVSFLLIAGNSYCEKVTGNREPRELWTLRPDRMKVIPGGDGTIRGYQYEVGGRKVMFANDLKDQPVRHIKAFHPLDDFYGMSPTEPAARAVNQHNEAMAHLQSLLENQATPRGGLKIPADQTLGDEERARVLAALETRFAGGGNAGRTMLLEGGLDWVAMGLSPTDMGIIDTKNSAARDISLAYGVPPQMLGIPGDSTYSNYQEARISFYEDTVLPLLVLLTDEFNDWLSDDFGGLELRPNIDRIPAIADKKRELWSMADTSTDLTIDERRELKGYPPLPNGAGQVLAPAVQQGQAFNADIKALQDRVAYG